MKENPQSEFSLESLGSLEYPTPFFVFSKRRILREYKRFRECFPEGSIYYAIKANSEAEILKTLSTAGCGFETASAYELRLLRTLDVPAERIIYGSCVKPADQIREFYQHGVDKYAADSFSEIRKIADAAPGSKVFIRVRVEDAGSAFRFSEKFGTELPNVLPMLREVERLRLEPYGLSFHVGSQASDEMAWAKALEHIAPVLRELRQTGIESEIVNIGGGFPCSYAGRNGIPTLEKISEVTLPRLKELPRNPKIILEPGRRMVAKAGVLVATVIGRVNRRDKTWLFLDAGAYNALFEAMACQASIEYKVESIRKSNASEKEFALAGPTGDGLDIITRSALLPNDVDVGDRLVLRDTGAYSLALSSTFNGFGKPSVYSI